MFQYCFALIIVIVSFFPFLVILLDTSIWVFDYLVTIIL